MARACRVAGTVLAVWLIAMTLPGLVYPPAIAAFRRTGLPDPLRYVLCLAEIAGAALLLVPRTWRWGAVLLALTLAAAIALHVAIGAHPALLAAYLVVLAGSSAGRHAGERARDA